MKCYNLDGIMTQLQKEIAEKRALLSAWEAVTFPTKKNGQPFAVMSKNISGATYKPDNYSMQPGEMVIAVNAWDKKCGYVSGEVKAYELVKYMKNGKPEQKPQNIQPEFPYFELLYKFDLDDIKEAISAEIESLKKEISALETQLEAAPAAYHAYLEAYANALDGLKNIAGQRSSLFYLIKDTIQDRFPYC